jgi:phytoene dehydrogenase-like protein
VAGFDSAGGDDGRRWRRLFAPVVDGWSHIAPHALGPVLRLPRHPIAMARFGSRALLPATATARRFDADEAAALFAGCAAHAFLPLERPLTSSFGVMLAASAHVAGWPFVRGGSQALADALAADLIELGGTIEVGRRVGALRELPPSRVVLLDVTPRQLAALGGDRFPARYRRRLLRYRYGPGAFKVDYALTEPVPWTNPDARRAGTLHLGGTIAEVALAEREVAAGRCAERPFVLAAQPTVVDPSRAPAGRHVLWTYCHVPHGFSGDPAAVTAAIEAQIERFAPGFRDVVAARHVADPAWFEDHNENYIGGDIAGGSHSGLQLVLRPTLGLRSYRTPDPRLFLCSASTPPGAGVHGMCGHHAANAALATVLR